MLGASGQGAFPCRAMPWQAGGCSPACRPCHAYKPWEWGCRPGAGKRLLSGMPTLLCLVGVQASPSHHNRHVQRSIHPGQQDGIRLDQQLAAPVCQLMQIDAEEGSQVLCRAVESSRWSDAK